MDPRSERAIRLGAEIETLRAKRDRLEEELKAIRKLIMMREIEFEHVLKNELATTAPMKSWAPPPETTAKSITDQVRDHFRRNQDLSFSPSEVLRCLNLADTQDAAVRQALKRLSDSDFLVKVGQGAYQLNPAHPERRKNWPADEDL